MSRKYDFAGWVTRNEIKCSDGVVIQQNAFKANDGAKVPLVWNHNYASPMNVLGHMILKNRPEGTYGYGYFNDTEEAANAKEMVRHGDISSMSIGARKIKRNGANVIHGEIYEVSLVLTGANPGAMIDNVISHAEDGTEEGIIYLDTIIHGYEEADDNDDEEEEMAKERSISEIIDEMTDEQKMAVAYLLGDEDDDYEDDDYEDDDDGGEVVKQNIFSNAGGAQEEILTHSDQEEIMLGAVQGKVNSFKEYMEEYNEQVLQHSITNIEYLFPEAQMLTKEPVIYRDTNTGYQKIIAGVTKSPFAKVKTMIADLTEETARARGYIKGSQKLEQVFKLLKRETTPQTIYKKQKLDRDDVIDIKDFDTVAFINREMRFMLEEEIARAILVGDGREDTSADKIKEENIRPIIKDDDMYTIKKTYTEPKDFVESVIKAMADYKGSGAPTMFIDPSLLADVKLLKGTDGRWLTGNIPTNTQLASQMDIKEIVPTTFMKDKGAIIVNLADYNVGSTRGGEITTFDDFDIDFNQYKYLIETRLSGALTIPKSAIYLSKGAGAEG